ncbi:MAG: serine/threonine protein kinase [Myxococcales bacterium]|nr:serine/threonine protein kinase [Myxococcales bacterium]
MEEAPLEAGALVAGRYRVEAPLGEGGMARIYRATDTHLDRPVALKVMRLVAAAHAARFEREARAAAGLRHPSVVRVFDFGVLDDGRPYLVLEFIEGRTLHQVITEEGPLGGRAALDLLRPIVGALAEVHAAGVIHRDLKPENLMLQPAPGLTALVRLLDFGIAAVDPLSTDERLTRTGAVFGTPAFMSPEQALGKGVTPASDVWAVGATLQCLVTGAPPFAADSPPEILVEVIRSAPAPLPDDVPGAVRGLIELCLQKDPAARPADGAALLARWPTAPRPVPPPVGVCPAGRRRPRAARRRRTTRRPSARRAARRSWPRPRWRRPWRRPPRR